MTPQKTRDLAKEIILITGGNGLIGKRLGEVLCEKYQVIALDVAPNLKPNKFIEYIGFDITNKQSIDAALERIKYAYSDNIASVVHLAAYYDFNGENSPLYEQITVKGTEGLLKQLNKKFHVEQFLFTSTNLVYKPCNPGQNINEESPVEPSWPYPESKVKTEKIIRQNKDDIPIVIARLAGAYDEWGHSIPLSHQVQRIHAKKITGYLYAGNKEKGNAFIHLDDVLDALELIIENRKILSSYEIFNLAEEKTYPYGELQDRIGMLLHGKEWATIEIPKPVAKAGAALQDAVGDPFIKPWMIDRTEDHYQMDISRAKNKIKWNPKHDLYQDLEIMIKNLKKDPDKWCAENNLQIPKFIKQE